MSPGRTLNGADIPLVWAVWGMPVTQLPPAEVRRDPLSERDRGVTPGC
jgi:hypothetical protein